MPAKITLSAAPRDRARARNSSREIAVADEHEAEPGIMDACLRVSLDEVLEPLDRDEPSEAGDDHVVGPKPEALAQALDLSWIGLEARASAPYGISSRRRRAPSLRARSSRSPLGAVTAAARARVHRVARPMERERSETAMSEPCSVTTSGRSCRRAATAPMGPFGTTQ